MDAPASSCSPQIVFVTFGCSAGMPVIGLKDIDEVCKGETIAIVVMRRDAEPVMNLEGACTPGC